MKIFPATAIALLCCTAILRAEDDLQTVQQELKDGGYYFGDVNGQAGPETTQALKRFQIRNGLEVTGQLNDETRKALKNGGDSGSNAPAATGDDSSSNQAPEVTPAAPENRGGAQSDLRAPSDDSAVQDRQFLKKSPPPALQGVPVASYGQIFRRTPYETAPPVVQRDTVRSAQKRLVEIGLYEGDPDGIPGPLFQRALSRYQSRTDLEVTGRLDLPTLAQLHLLPRMEHSAPHIRVILHPGPGGGIWIP
ncbi:MAG: peptidoglycan-binding domain-containing protein [Chthoniobacteraceae bacterium]